MARHIIKLKDYLKVVEEYDADDAITPGMFIGVNADNEVAVVANEDAGVMIADYDAFQGKTIDDAYAAGDKVQCWIPQRGDVAYAILTAGEDVAIGAKLAIGTGGKLVEVATGTGDAVAVAQEAVDLSGTGAVDGRIIVRIL